MNALKERLSKTRWVADRIRGQAREASLAGILRTIEQRGAEEDITNYSAQSQSLLGIIDRIDAHKDRLVFSLKLAALEETDAVHIPILAVFEIPFQRRQNGCAKPIIIAAEYAQRQDQDFIGLVADVKR